ncbi:MAG: DoxX family membrane protein [Flavobacteriales bacterium]|nr:DoxX family membrane protein [Flavobacteriales bacterium]
MASGREASRDQVERNRKKIVTTVIRVLLGVVFVFSALVKLIDPLGLAFKIGDYLSPEALNVPFLSPMAENLSIALIALELILGISLLLGRFKVFTLWTLFVLNGAFMLLTLYTAVTGAVSDCGCFGDALPMGPWESFAKNVVICVMIVVLILWQRFIKPVAGFRTSMSVVALAFAVVYGMSYYALHNEPLIDFRPYKVGVNIKEAMCVPEDAQLPVYENRWVYEIDGERHTFKDEDEPWNMREASFVSRESVLVKDGFRPAIENFMVMDVYGGDMTDSLLVEKDIYLVLCYDYDEVDEDVWDRVKIWAEGKTSPVWIVSNSSSERFSQVGLELPVMYADPVMIKTIARSRPAVVHLQEGTIISKESIK